MGSVCSKSPVLIKDNHESLSTPSTNASFSTNTTKTIQSASVWNPFHITRMEAEDLLKTSDPGSFIFSRDMTSELFLSLRDFISNLFIAHQTDRFLVVLKKSISKNLLYVRTSVGKYVCHHSVVTRDNSYFVGAQRFDTVGDVISYFKDHPLGEVTLKEEYKRPPPNMTNVQVKQHPDVLIQSSNATASNSETSSSENEGGRQLSNYVPESPAQRRRQNQRVPIARIEEECAGNSGNAIIDVVEQGNIANGNTALRLPKNKVGPLTRKPLTRSEAIDHDFIGSTSSEDDREVPSSISLMPFIPRQDYPMTSSPVSS